MKEGGCYSPGLSGLPPLRMFIMSGEKKLNQNKKLVQYSRYTVNHHFRTVMLSGMSIVMLHRMASFF